MTGGAPNPAGAGRARVVSSPGRDPAPVLAVVLATGAVPLTGVALVPALDRTRTVGLVTLPGAFVGVLLGSGDPVRAAGAQILVLVGLLAAETVAALVTVELVARQRIVRDPPHDRAPV